MSLYQKMEAIIQQHCMMAIKQLKSMEVELNLWTQRYEESLKAYVEALIRHDTNVVAREIVASPSPPLPLSRSNSS